MSMSSSEDEDIEECYDSLKLNWIDLSVIGHPETVAIGSLPGCRFKNIRRNVDRDLEQLKSLEILEVFVLCTRGELNKYRVPTLFEKYEQYGILFHHYPFPDGTSPEINCLMKLIAELINSISRGHRVLIHCFGGLGRSCAVAACLILHVDDGSCPDETIEKLRQLCGPGAVQTVKQYNFVHEFRSLRAQWQEEYNDRLLSRSVSR